MKTIKLTILFFLITCSIYSLNAQMEIFPDGSIHVGNTATSHAKININGTALQIGNTATPNSAIKANSDGTLNFGDVTAPALKVNPGGTVNIGKTNSQIIVGSDGTLNLGDVTTPALKVNPDGIVTMSKLIEDDIYGFTFAPHEHAVLIPGSGGSEGLMIFKDVLSLEGLSNETTDIGSMNNHMYAIYSKFIFLSGGTAGVLSLSDAKLKTNIRKLSSTSEKMLKLNPVTYDFIRSGSGEDVSNDPFYKNRTGFIAQEVQEIFPDLIVIGSDSLLRLDYAGLIPYLTKALQEQSQSIQKQDELILAQERINKEQNEIIEKLQQQINDIQKGIYTADFIIDGEPAQPNKAPKPQIKGADNALYQNSPNPFNISTTIKYQLSDNATNAKICIYNLTGKQLQCYNLQATKGENSIEVRASSLQSGMYLYSLIVNDKLIDTKRMILTE